MITDREAHWHHRARMFVLSLEGTLTAEQVLKVMRHLEASLEADRKAHRDA